MLASIVALILHHVMAVLMLAVGLQTTVAELRSTWSQRALLWKSLVVLLIGVPLLGLATALVLPLTPRAAAFVAIMAGCPGAPMAFRALRGRTMCVAIIAIVSILAPLTVFVWVEILDHVFAANLSVTAHTLAVVAVRQLLPLAIGIAVASSFPRVAPKLARITWFVFMAALAIAIVVVLVKGAPELLTANRWAIAAVVVMAIGSAAMGHWAGRPDRENSRLLATIAVLGNPALAIAVISSSDPGFRPGALFFAYLLARALCLVPYTLWSKRWARRPPTRIKFGPPAAAPPAAVHR
jgi:BASS family bile acid:Na+ symporter